MILPGCYLRKTNDYVFRAIFQSGYNFVIQTSFSFSESGFMCLEVKYRSENVISARIGRLSRNQNEACDTELFFDKSIQSTTLISKLSNIFYQAQLINMIYYDTVNRINNKISKMGYICI